MTEQQIEAFLAVVREGGFSKAAQSLYISQPAVTYRIRMLEEELGVRLFVKENFRAALTPAGEALIDRAQALHTAFEEARRSMRRYAPTRTIVIGFPPRMLEGDSDMFLEIMRLFKEEEEGIALRSARLERAPVHVQQLMRGDVDVILTDLGLTELSDSRFCRRKLFSDRVLVCMSQSHPLAHRKRLTLDELSEERVFSYEESSVFPMRMAELFERGGITPHGETYPSFAQLLPELIAGNGVALTNRHPIRLHELAFVPLELKKEYDIGLAWLRERDTPQMRRLVEEIERVTAARRQERERG